MSSAERDMMITGWYMMVTEMFMGITVENMTVTERNMGSAVSFMALTEEVINSTRTLPTTHTALLGQFKKYHLRFCLRQNHLRQRRTRHAL
jgi:hypothetical protein